jgi:hypothetical protein
MNDAQELPTVVVDEDTWERLEDAAREQHLSTQDYAAGLLHEAMHAQWVSVHALVEMADEIRGREAK